MGVKRFVWDEVSDNVLLETDETDTVTARYCQRPERFGEPLFQDRSGTKSFYHFDGNSSTCNLTNSSEGVTDTTLYTAYGEEVSSSGATPNPFGYKGAVGYYTNGSTGDIYVRNRSYEPAIGRWMSKDPLGFVDGTNSFRAYYVPTSVDPIGLLTITPENVTCPGCGRASMQWFLESEIAGQQEFYVVQKICLNLKLIKCEPNLIDGCCRPGTEEECSECWYEFLINLSDGRSNNRDTWGFPFKKDKPDEKCGYLGSGLMTSEIRTFDFKQIAIEKEKWLPPGEIKCIGYVDVSEHLPGDTELAWWDNHTGQYFSYMQHTWNCCDKNERLSVMIHGTTGQWPSFRFCGGSVEPKNSR